MNSSRPLPRLLVSSAVLLSALVALWQFYLFVWFKDPAGSFDPQGGTVHLWLAVTAALVACAAGALLFFWSVNHEQDEVMHITL